MNGDLLSLRDEITTSEQESSATASNDNGNEHHSNQQLVQQITSLAQRRGSENTGRDDLKNLKLDDLKNAVENIEEDSQDREKSRKLLEKIKASAESRNETPSHSEIMEVVRVGSHETKLKVSMDSLKSAWEHGRDREGNPLERIDQITEIPHGKEYASYMESKCINGNDSGEVEIYCRQITKEEGRFSLREIPFYQTKEIPTDEALIVIRLNNGESVDDRTVVLGLVKIENGVPKFDESPGVYKTMSEREYLENIQGRTYKKEETYKTLDESNKEGGKKPQMNRLAVKAARGEVSIDDYHKQFEKENGKTLEEHWKQWDKEIANDRRFFTSERRKSEIFNRLQGRYEEITKAVDEKIQKIENIEAEETSKLEIKQLEFLKNPNVLMCLEGLNSGDPEIVQYYKDILYLQYKLSYNEIEGLIQRRGVGEKIINWENDYKARTKPPKPTNNTQTTKTQQQVKNGGNSS